MYMNMQQQLDSPPCATWVKLNYIQQEGSKMTSEVVHA